jgi:hypothetical protein
MAPRYHTREATELEFDVTQQIDPALTELLRAHDDPSVLHMEFDDPDIAFDF